MAFGATGVFGQLQASLNKIWEVPREAERRHPRRSSRKRASAFGMILGIGLLLFLSLAASTALSAVHALLDARFPIAGFVLPLSNFALSFAMVTALFAMILKMLPDVRIEWGDVWLGAAVTALLFTVGKALIGLYLGRAGVTSVYGAAGLARAGAPVDLLLRAAPVPGGRVHRGVLAALRLAAARQARVTHARPARTPARLTKVLAVLQGPLIVSLRARSRRSPSRSRS